VFPCQPLRRHALAFDDVINVATLAVTDHIPKGANPEMFELSQDQKTLYVPNKV
jgi:hypothetical protein